MLIGIGGIGCAAASYLASSGIGRLTICDFDSVDATNLGRQILFGDADVGASKSSLAAERLSGLNPAIQIDTITERLDDNAMDAAVAAHDVVLDGTDNFSTRFQVNDACVNNGRCLVSGSAIRLEGQLAVFGPDYDESPCYRCLYSEADESLESCAGNGVMAPVPGVIGTLMAVETLKHLIGIDSPRGKLLLYDASSGDMTRLTINKRDDCPACA